VAVADNDAHAFCGVHLLGELYGVRSEWLNDISLLEEIVKKGIEASGATLCSLQAKQFVPWGVSLLFMLAESHISLHSYPEHQALFFDVFFCGTRCRPYCIVEALLADLHPSRYHVQKILRGS
jgi:S-adenosylmethionine decarboxylase